MRKWVETYPLTSGWQRDPDSDNNCYGYIWSVVGSKISWGKRSSRFVLSGSCSIHHHKSSYHSSITVKTKYLCYLLHLSLLCLLFFLSHLYFFFCFSSPSCFSEDLCLTCVWISEAKRKNVWRKNRWDRKVGVGEIESRETEIHCRQEKTQRKEW